MSSDALLSSTEAPSHSIIHMHSGTRGVRWCGWRPSSQPATPTAVIARTSQPHLGKLVRAAGEVSRAALHAGARTCRRREAAPTAGRPAPRDTLTEDEDGDVAARLQRSRRALARPGAHWTRTRPRRRWMWRRRNSVPARAGAPAAAFAPAKAQAFFPPRVDLLGRSGPVEKKKRKTGVQLEAPIRDYSSSCSRFPANSTWMGFERNPYLPCSLVRHPPDIAWRKITFWRITRFMLHAYVFVLHTLTYTFVTTVHCRHFNIHFRTVASSPLTSDW